jgi:putative membrane protein
MTTPSVDPPSTGVARRLHPLSWIFALTAYVPGLILPGVALLATSRTWASIDVFLIPAAAVVVLRAFVHQLSVRYELHDTELVVRRNLVIHRSERHIPFGRIHNLTTSASPIHRWLGVVEVVVETAGSTEPEATLRVLSLEALAELRSRVASSAPDPAATAAITDASARAAERTVLFAMDLRQLVLWGVLNNRGLVIAGALAGLAWEVTTSLQGGQPWDPRTWTAPWSMVRVRGLELFTAATHQSPLTIVLVVVAALVVLKILSAAWALATLHGFRVERSEKSLTVEHGLFPRTSTAIPFARIQRIVVHDRPLLRLTGHVEVLLDIAGGAPGEGNKQPVWLAPLVAREALPGLLAGVGLSIAPDDAPWTPLHRHAPRRARTRMLIALAILSALASPVAGWRFAGLGFVVLAPFAIMLATRQSRAIHYAAAATQVWLWQGWQWRTLQLTWVDRVQVIAVRESPFDRRHGMASVVVDTAAGGGLGARMSIPFLDAATAQALARRLAVAAGAAHETARGVRASM